MPDRILRDWTDSPKFEGLSADAERLFTRLIMKADDFGRFHGDSRLIKAACFPLIETLRTNEVERWLIELSTRQLILCYETNGRKLLAIVNFGQRLRTVKAKFPQPAGERSDWLPIADNFGQLANICQQPVSNPPQIAADDSNSPQSALEEKRREEKRNEERESVREDFFETTRDEKSRIPEIVALYPKRAALAEAAKALAKHLDDGTDLEAVEAGTRAIAAVIHQLPSGANNRFVMSPDRFFRERRWEDDPETWKAMGAAGRSLPAKPELNLGGRANSSTVVNLTKKS